MIIIINNTPSKIALNKKSPNPDRADDIQEVMTSNMTSFNSYTQFIKQ